ncbi:MAG: CxxC-x17-CxxC domain-containing protein [Candidatus Sungbacteria bacterium]|nr:type IV secretion system DNA-binding domain-containing protein [bacterium]MDZ4260521.1 CxxC-x17-CxxC domain-containing protein [Candidatus Sungbacteria bacterium]
MANPEENGITFIGKCNFRGNDRVFGIKKRDRRQHMYVVGKTGVGKSVLLKNMALQDIHAGRGIGIVDPHGEFVEQVLEQIPKERINDVIYFNPVDSDYPIGFNILEVSDAKYKHLVVSDLLGIFTKIWANVWSARMEYILQNCILALIDTPGSTLLGIPRILVEKEYRDKIVANVTDPVVRSFWTQEYETWRDQFRNEAIVPIQNKVGQFLNTGFVRNIVGQPTSSINISDIMNTGKILLVNVAKGRIGEDNAALLGAMLITKIQLAAMERVRIAEDERLDFYLYVDEFQNFSTDSFAAILSEARKYRLNLFIAHQYVGQLVTDVSTKVRDAVFGNVGTMISFRVGATDAEFLEKEFTPEFLMADLINLPNYHIYLKLMVDGLTSRPFSAVTIAPLKFDVEPDIRERIIDASRRQYSRPREEVEKAIAQWGNAGGMEISEGRSARPGASAASGGTRTASGAEMFEAQCWNCGKMTQVPFKPDGKRPVYCLQCLKQIEEGKLVPLPDRMPKVGRERYASTLGELGIEFESKAGDRNPPEVRAREEIRPRVDSRREEQHPRAERTVERAPLQRPQPQNRGTDHRPLPSGDFRQEPRPFKPSEPRERPKMPEQRQEERMSPGPGVRSQPIVRVPQSSPKVSLSTLKSSEKEISVPKPIQKEVRHEQVEAPGTLSNGVNTSDLRGMLNQFLSEKKEKVVSQEQQSDTQEEIKSKPSKDEQNILKPGETIKF